MASSYSKTPIEYVATTWVLRDEIQVERVAAALQEHYRGSREEFHPWEVPDSLFYGASIEEQQGIVAALQLVSTGDRYATIFIGPNAISVVRKKPYPGWNRLRLRLEKFAKEIYELEPHTVRGVILHYYDELELQADHSLAQEWFQFVPLFKAGAKFDEKLELELQTFVPKDRGFQDLDVGIYRPADPEDDGMHHFYFSAISATELNDVPMANTLAYLDDLHVEQIEAFEAVIGPKFREFLR